VIFLYLVSAAIADSGSVQLTGTVTGCAGQPVMVEILRAQDTGLHPLLVWSGVLNDGEGEFHISIPAQLGETLLRAAVDAELNGIGVDDPQIVAPIPLLVGTQIIEGIDIVIEPAPLPILDPSEEEPLFQSLD
jgi:hypothetical protein